jgi:murein DD-endopeptidase MepM/ murein hydrolase activator NlpD
MFLRMVGAGLFRWKLLQMLVLLFAGVSQVYAATWTMLGGEHNGWRPTFFLEQQLAPKYLQLLKKQHPSYWHYLENYPQDIHFFIRSDGSDSSGSLVASLHPGAMLELKMIPGKPVQVNMNSLILDHISAIDFSIKRNLYLDGRKAGISPFALRQLISGLAHRINANTGLHPADHLRVLLGHYRTETGMSLPAKVLDVRLQQAGKKFVRFTWFGEDLFVGKYYLPKGQALHGKFLKKPLSYSRISALFSRKRQHPILHVKRPHSGVDLAAKRGTPVWAVANGQIVWMGWRGGYGRAVIVQHDSHYSTLYGHFSRFATIHKGQWVKAHQRLGYVGSTGLATGPHLHYELRHNGKAIDPLHYAMPEVKGLRGKDLYNLRLQQYQYDQSFA